MTNAKRFGGHDRRGRATTHTERIAYAALLVGVVGGWGGCGGCADPSAEARPAEEERVEPWSSAEACRRAEIAPREPLSARVASWNVRWFPDGTFRDERDPERATDVPWVACIMANLDAEVIAVQEFKNHARAKLAQKVLLSELDELTGGRWRLRLDDCPYPDLTHLGFLYDETRVTARDFRSLHELNPFEDRCGGAQHPGLGGTFRFANGREVSLVVVHSVSGGTPQHRRMREETFAALEEGYHRVAPSSGGQVIFLGDFNTEGCSECDPPLSAADEVEALAARLRRFDPPMRLLDQDVACTEYAWGKPWPLDHVVAPMTSTGLSVVDVAGFCDALACRADVGLPHAHDVLSDHCPLVLSIGPP